MKQQNIKKPEFQVFLLCLHFKKDTLFTLEPKEINCDYDLFDVQFMI